MARILWNWTAADPMSRFRTAVDRLFETFGEGAPAERGFWEADAYPRMAGYDLGEHFVLEAEVPGVRLEDLEITCIDRTLAVRGERPDPDGSGGTYERRERPTGAFLRTVELPEDVDAEQTDATLEEGILRITIPKSKRASPRRIEIRTSAEAGSASDAAKKKEEK